MCLAALSGIAAFSASCRYQQSEMSTPTHEDSEDRPSISLQRVTQNELLQVLDNCKGTPTLIYFWADYSMPDRHLLAKVAQLRNKYPRKDLNIISVCVLQEDQEVQIEKARARVLKILLKADAAFPNFLLPEELEEWFKQWETGALMAFVLFDRQGNIICKLECPDRDIEKQIEQVLKKP